MVAEVIRYGCGGQSTVHRDKPRVATEASQLSLIQIYPQTLNTRPVTRSKVLGRTRHVEDFGGVKSESVNSEEFSLKSLCHR